MSSGNEFGIVFLGVGHPHAGPWARAVGAIPGVRLLGAYDPDRPLGEAFARQHGGSWVEPEAAARPEVAAVVVDGRNDQVAELTLAALGHGKPVLLEKPGGMNAGELARIEAKARRAGLVVQIGYFLRYADSIAEAKRALAAGELGTVSLARIHAAMPRRAWGETADWFRDPTNIVGIFQEDACHIVDIAFHLFGEPNGVSALRAVGAFEASMREDALVATLDYGTFLVTLDFTAQEANPWVENWSVEIYGTSATLRAGVRPSWMERFDEGGFWRTSDGARPATREDYLDRGPAADVEHYRRGAAAFVAAVRGEVPSPIDATTGLAVFRGVEAIYEAAERRAYVEFPGGEQ